MTGLTNATNRTLGAKHPQLDRIGRLEVLAERQANTIERQRDELTTMRNTLDAFLITVRNQNERTQNHITELQKQLNRLNKVHGA